MVFKENSKIGVQRYDNELYLFFMIETEWRLLKITNCSVLKITFPPLSRSIWWISLPFDRRANGYVAFKSVGYTDKVAYFGNPALLLSDRSSLTTYHQELKDLCFDHRRFICPGGHWETEGRYSQIKEE